MKKIKKLDVVIAISMTALSVFLFYLGAIFKIERKLAYREEGNMDYKVYLKANSDYDEPFLGKDRKYIASLIDHIDVDYKYKFSCDQEMDYTCNYYIMASASVKEGGEDSKLIYQKDKYLLSDMKKEVTGKKEITLNESVRLSYEEYNKIIDQFNTKYGLSGNKNTLTVSLGIELKGKNGDFEVPLTDKSSLQLSLPLTDKTLAIGAEYNDIDAKGQKTEISSNRTINNIFFALGAIFAVLSLGMLFTIVKEYIRLKSKETRYEKEKAEIMNHYGKIISSVDDIKSVSVTSFIDVDDFIDLVNIRDCLEKPVLFSETHDGQEVAWFLVVDNETAYRYILKGKSE